MRDVPECPPAGQRSVLGGDDRDDRPTIGEDEPALWLAVERGDLGPGPVVEEVT